MFRILHLSDIHIGKTYKEPESIACKIAADIDNNGLSCIKCIIVTGDIFDGQVPETEELIKLAVDFFETLLREINCYQEENEIHKGDVIFVPGNHDIVRIDDKENRWKKYNKFLTKFYGEIPEFYNSENYSLIKQYDDHKIVFVGLNSCQIEKKKLFDDKYIEILKKNISEEKLAEHNIDKAEVVKILKAETAEEYDDYGYIPMSQITPLERKIKKLNDYNVIALFHHHFYLFPEIAYKFGDSSLVRNYTEVIQHLKYMNVSVVLHGHKHYDLERPFILDDYYNSSDNIIDVFAGGSVGTSRTDMHTFSVLDLYDKKNDIKLVHNKFVYNKESLMPIVRKQIPPQKNYGRIVKLLEVLENEDKDRYDAYMKVTEKCFKSYESSCKVVSWISELMTGFSDVYKYLNSDVNNVLFLLYAVNYRLISYMSIIGKDDSYYDTISAVWESFYDSYLENNNFQVSKLDYHKLFSSKRLKDSTPNCDKLLNACSNKTSQHYLAFTMLGMFFTDLYLVLTNYADDFKESIKYKVNIKIEENEFHKNVPASRIIIRSDEDRRSAYIDLYCDDATAHKMAVLFIKEFDLLINKFEDYFKLIGLKLYYLIPKIDKDRMKNTLDNYNFEAYIPNLLPLLTGDKIYLSKVVFARELIQNSIDAIAVREAKDKSSFSKTINIELKVDENGKRYFKIIDNGTGMDRYKIERYFTSIGRSYYIGDEYKDLKIDYKPISNFGIGFLSSFMVCQEIDVRTRYFKDDKEGLRLHIPNYDGCFFIELDDSIKVGTEIKLYLNTELTNENIVDYIKSVMQDIKYDINITYLDEKNQVQTESISAHNIRKSAAENGFIFLIPFLENKEVEDINNIEELSYDKFVNQYEYGIMICKNMELQYSGKYVFLNSGIVVKQASENMLLAKEYPLNNLKNNDIVINFPSNWLELDVSRDSINKFKKDRFVLKPQIIFFLYNQLLQFMQTISLKCLNIPVINLQEIIEFLMLLCSGSDEYKEIFNNLSSLKYVLKIEIKENGLSYQLVQGDNTHASIILQYANDQAKQKKRFWVSKMLEERESYEDPEEDIKLSDLTDEEFFANPTVNIVHSVLNHNYSYKTLSYEIILSKSFNNDSCNIDLCNNDLSGVFSNLPSTSLKKEDEKYIMLLTSYFLVMPEQFIVQLSHKTPVLLLIIKQWFLNYFKIGEENKFEISYKELEEEEIKTNFFEYKI